MRFSTVCSIVLSLFLCVTLVGCGGDTGEKVGNDAKKLSTDYLADMPKEMPKDPKEIEKKMKEMETKWKSKIDAIETRYKALSADEKKKADAIMPGIGEIGKKP